MDEYSLSYLVQQYLIGAIWLLTCLLLLLGV